MALLSVCCQTLGHHPFSFNGSKSSAWLKCRSQRERGLLMGLFRTHGEDLFALDFDFDAEGWTDIASLDYAAAHPDVAGKIGSLQRIVESAAARIADEGMIGAGEAVVLAKPFQVGDVFELAGAIRSLTRESPVARGKSGRAGGQADDRRWNIFTGQAIADEKVR